MYLMPDIVLSCSAEEFGVKPQPREGVLMCLRGDVEKSIPDSFWDALKESISQQGKNWLVTDMGYDRIIDQSNRADVVRAKMQEFRGAELAVTDRLHGMVFAALSGTPCIVFGNYNHKVKSTYDWIQFLSYIRFADTVEVEIDGLNYRIDTEQGTAVLNRGVRRSKKPLIIPETVTYSDEIYLSILSMAILLFSNISLISSNVISSI